MFRLADLKASRSRRGHRFLPCDLSFDDPCFTDIKGLTPKQVTDVYLAALALKHGTSLATFDDSIPVDVFVEGDKAIEQIPV